MNYEHQEYPGPEQQAMYGENRGRPFFGPRPFFGYPRPFYRPRPYYGGFGNPFIGGVLGGLVGSTLFYPPYGYGYPPYYGGYYY